MFDFIKKLYKDRGKNLTIILLDDEGPESSNSYELRPSKLFGLFYLSLLTLAIFLIILVMFTPLGSLVYNKQDERLRESVIEISNRISSLQDSLRARDRQLRKIQQVLSQGEDTTFQIADDALSLSTYSNTGQEQPQNWSPEISTDVNAYESFSRREIIFSGILKETPSFPAPYPVQGTLTRGFNQESGHLGIDIATENQAMFQAVADGTVINYDWTMNYGYVIHIQHENGIVSIYKHAASLSKDVGDIVLKGDIVGRVGNVGTLSTGPHLHIEIWRNGVPQNPLMYLVNS